MSTESKFLIAPILATHKRSEFDCGVEDMNRFLREQARQDTEKGLSRTFVCSSETDSEVVIGYYTLASTLIDFTELPQEKRLSRYPVPVVLLARLAVDVHFRGQDFGERLLFDAQARTEEIADRTGVFAMILDAREESVVPFYMRYDFVRAAPNSLRMYKTIKAIRKLQLRTGVL